MDNKKFNKRTKQYTFYLITIFFIIVILVAVAMNLRNSVEQRNIIEDSVKSQLISISIAASEIIDVNEFEAYNSVEDTLNNPNYEKTLMQLRNLSNDVGANYIYALKKIGDEYYFVFDTDTEDEEIFIPYEISPVHRLAFAGNETADVMNVDDLYGSFNTGAVPLWKDGRVIGIISTDIEDVYLERSIRITAINSAVLVIVLLIAMAVAFIIINRLLKRVKHMQNRLEYLAHYDNVTSLPNRQYLMEYLEELSKDKKTSFALLFIDLDNFKLVNDTAGHDAGDELLRYIATFLKGSSENVKSFRPAAGQLNIAARVGGDEFIQVISGIGTEEEAVTVGEKLLNDFKAHTNERYIEKYNVGMSVGIALYPFHSENYHVLIKYADIAMYHAKRSGKNCFMVYDDEMEQKPEK